MNICRITISKGEWQSDGKLMLSVEACDGPLPPQSIPVQGIFHDVSITHVPTGDMARVVTWSSFEDFLADAKRYHGDKLVVIGLSPNESSTPRGMSVLCEGFSRNAHIADFAVPGAQFTLKWEDSKVSPSDACFIATACYGSAECAEVMRLRRFRDERLLKSKTGKAFVKLYYQYSPPIASAIRNSSLLKSSVRKTLVAPAAWFSRLFVS